ncbi:MAG: InlB B-repeat-containing protein [Muribaculaceae bacterium]|nr:InlB B-repeat-containing protein [Muribaculaceae bacterium]
MKTKLITLLVAILSVGILYAQSDMDGIKLNDIPTYTIKTSSSTGGTATTSLNEVVTGGSVTLNAYANSGYGFKNWTVNGTVVSAYNPYTVTPTGNTTYKANFVPIKSGLYMGIMGFNKELNNKNIGILTSDTKSSFTNFVNNLTTQKGTILYYAVENAIDSLATATLPGDLESVIMITFTDGLDQGSFMMNNKYESIDEYLTVLNNKIKNTKVQRLPINAYSIGLKGSDVVDDVQFQNNLTNLASSPENAIEVSSMDEVNTKLQEIATAIYQEKNGETIKLTIPGQSPNTKIRFTFDNVTDASKSQFYIEGTFSNDYSLKNVVYSGMTSKSGLIVAGETDGFEVTYTFKDIEVTNVLYDRLPTSNLKQWSYVTSSSKWQKNSEFSPEESSIIEIRPTVIMLVLDCSSSLGSQFTTMKTYANNFIKKIEEGPKYYTVSASANTGGTAVASSENVREGGNVRLTAIPNDGYKFKNWTKNGSVVSTSNPDTVTITANSTFVANFEIAPTYTVKVSANTGGTAVASSENMWEGGSVILTATPKSGYKFKNWTKNGSVVSTSNPYTATITEYSIFVANFEIIPTYTVSVSANTGGTAVASSNSVEYGGSVTLTATPNSGYKFKNWTKNGSVVSTSNPYTATISANSSFIANFEKITYTVSVSANTGGTATASASSVEKEGAGVTLTATPDSGYKFKNWTLNGNVVSTNKRYYATITANSHFVANFEKLTYEVIVYTNTGGTATASANIVEYGGSVTLTATPEPDSKYVFINWKTSWFGDDFVSTSNPYTATITENSTFIANFQIPTYTVSVSANTGGTATASASSVENKDNVILTAIPDSGYKFKNWTLNGNVVSTNWCYYATITANSNFVANFYKSTDIDVHEYVDLGLSVKWADCNVGATSPVGYGDYFSWGETSPKEIYNWDSSYKWDDSNYYSNENNKTILDLEDDAAYVNWGGNWRMPTIEEFQELIDNCTWTESTHSGVNGVIVTSKINGNSIFLPKAGYRSGPDYVNKGSRCCYWSSSRYVENNYDGHILWISIKSPSMFSMLRYQGLTIRAVYDINNTAIEEIDTNSAFVYAGNGVIYINNHIGNVKVIGVSGQVVKDVYIDGNDTLEVTPGLYIVKTGNKVTKIVVK